ncbi:MAG: ABC transporter permease [Armatimonadota bacterium]|nr:ABC transporter permease [bacterium]MDW8320171.1 ABC transporter permease [Armatimonadota bacterium]
MRRLFRARELGILLVLAAEIAVFSLLTHRPDRPNPMLDADNLLATVRDMTVLATAALGSCVVIIAGGIDLSVGSCIALTSVVTAYAIVSGYSPVTASLLGVLTAMAMGFLSATFVTRAKLPPFIATLGMMSIARGLAYLVTKGATIPIPDSHFTRGLGSGMVPFPGLAVPVPVLLLLLCAVLFHLLMTHTRWGREIYALGGSEEAARLSGVPIVRLKYLVYTVGGLMAGLAGVIFTAYYGTGQSTAAMGWELDAIASVVIGGGSLSGGRGSVWGTCIGALIFQVLRSGLAMVGASDYNQLIIGAVVIAVVAFDQMTGKRRMRVG